MAYFVAGLKMCSSPLINLMTADKFLIRWDACGLLATYFKASFLVLTFNRP